MHPTKLFFSACVHQLLLKFDHVGSNWLFYCSFYQWLFNDFYPHWLSFYEIRNHIFWHAPRIIFRQVQMITGVWPKVHQGFTDKSHCISTPMGSYIVHNGQSNPRPAFGVHKRARWLHWYTDLNRFPVPRGRGLQLLTVSVLFDSLKGSILKAQRFNGLRSLCCGGTGSLWFPDATQLAGSPRSTIKNGRIPDSRHGIWSRDAKCAVNTPTRSRLEEEKTNVTSVNRVPFPAR